MRTPITYYGGKQKMAAGIVSMLPAHKIYCEPYFGGGAVFFQKQPSFLEVINDKNDNLINFYIQTQTNFQQLKNYIDLSLYSERMHRHAKDLYYGIETGTDIEKAWAVWYAFNFSFVGSVYGGWKWSNGGSGSHDARNFTAKQKSFNMALKNRMQHVQISCRDALRVIEDRDTQETVFYLDPPYPGCYQQHYTGFTHQNLYELLQFLTRIKGKFILSIYWSQTVRFHVAKYGWNVKTVKTNINTANLGNAKDRHRTEILVYNFDIQKDLFSNI